MIMICIIRKRFITMIDIKVFFYQYGVYPDHWDFFITIPDRGLEYLIITLMGF